MIKEVLEFNEQRGLLNTFDPQLEFSMLLEEVLELRLSNKECIKSLVCVINNLVELLPDDYKKVTKKAFADATDDIKVLANGARGKCIRSDYPEYSLEDIEKIIKYSEYVVTEANSKKGNKKDANGKIIKDADFIPPNTPMCLEDLPKE